jgi:hypothetical protein
MIRAFTRLPTLRQFLALLSAIFAVGIFLFIQLQNTIVQSQALHRAKDTANLVEAVGDLASYYNGFWVFSDPMKAMKAGDFLDAKVIDHGLPSGIAPQEEGIRAAAYASLERAAGKVQESKPKGTAFDIISAEDLQQLTAFIRKNPASVQREFSDIVEASTMRVKFKLTSHRTFNPNNAPNEFEKTALDALRRNGSIDTEYWEFNKGSLLYARRLTAKKACMSCHGTPENAPEVIRAKYLNSNGFGYEEGGVAGLISVTVPLDANSAIDLFLTMPAIGWVAFTMLVGLTLIAVVWFTTISSSARAMSLYMQQILQSKPGQRLERFALDADEASSRNELHRVSLGIKALHRALRIAQKT